MSLLQEVPHMRACPGVYFLLKHRKPVYIGQSNNVIIRVRGHWMRAAFSFTEALYTYVPQPVLRSSIERCAIALLKPPRNSHPGPGTISPNALRIISEIAAEMDWKLDSGNIAELEDCKTLPSISEDG